MRESPPPAPQGIALVARQPILDARQDLVGYELLFRPVSDAGVSPTPDRATASVSVQALMDIGLERLAPGVRAWVNVPRNLLTERHFRFLPPERVVLEVLEDVAPDPEVIEALAEARATGYSVALDDFVLDDPRGALVRLADVIKVDVYGLDGPRISATVASLERSGARLLAEKVETREVHEMCLEAGFELFQGYFYARPSRVAGKRLPVDRASLLRLLAEIQDPRTSIEHIEGLVEVNVGLGIRLLRYVNSAVIGVRREIESIQHAIMMLGLERVRSCVTMLLLSGVDKKSPELVTTALVRARFCQLLGERARGAPEQHFTAGMLSLVDAFLDKPLEDVVAELGLSPDLAAALLRHEGLIGESLATAIACERSDWKRVAGSRWNPGELRTAYLDALAWTSRIQSELRSAAA